MSAPSRAALVAAITALAAALPAFAEPADDVVASVSEPALRVVLDDVLAKSPMILAARARALASDQVAPQETALPDPQIMVTAYPRSPDSQVGLEYSQEYVPKSRRRLMGEAAGHEATGAWADLEAERLAAVTEARAMWLEIAYLDEAARISREERETLVHFEALARARYASGEGLQQDVVKLQAEITRAELELVELQSERDASVLALNAMRGRPGQYELAVPVLPAPAESAPDPRAAAALASALRPELRAAAARIAAARTRIEVARKERTPMLMLRGGWTFMRGGGMGDDKDGLENDEAMGSVGISLPVRKHKLAAMLEQAVQEQQAAAFERDGAALGIERDAGQAASRIGFTLRQLALNEGVLSIQSAEALRSAEEAYATGLAGSLELLDAERELFDVRKGAARARADLAVLTARLEGIVGAPLSALAAVPNVPADSAAPAAQVKP